MKVHPRSRFVLVFLFIVFGSIAYSQQTVKYGASTFTVYEPLPDLAPTPLCGFSPEVPGYTLKSPNYGPGTYYAYAPGSVPSTKYKCALTEIRDWIGYRPEQVKELAAKKGLKQISEKDIQKMFKNTRLPNDGLMYALSDSSWIWFYIYELQNSGPKAWASNEPYVVGVSYIKKIPAQTDKVLDVMYRFWNDGVHFADYAGFVQSNSKTRPSAPSDKNPNNFSVGDVLNRTKGFYTMSFAGAAPSYLWHSYEKVVSENLKKADFDASGTIGYNDIFSAFIYEFNMVKIKNDIYVSYDVNSIFLKDLQPGVTWQKEMANRKESDKQEKEALKATQKANEKALEMLYKEIFM